MRGVRIPCALPHAYGPCAGHFIPLPPNFEPVKIYRLDDPDDMQETTVIVWSGDRPVLVQGPVLVQVACGPAAPYPARRIGRPWRG